MDLGLAGFRWTFSQGAGFALIGLLLIWLWVPDDAGKLAPGREKVAILCNNSAFYGSL
jgi:predicted MFS family arabinose efflux permease